MRITTSSGDYKIQFVHSSHGFETIKPVTPGGLRQFIDNLACSLRRRVSFCDISRVEPADGVNVESPVYVSIAQGFAICYHKDQFDKKTGRAFSLDRALLNTELTEAEQDEVWAMVWGAYAPTRPSLFGH
jgi:hypothetical protein